MVRKRSALSLVFVTSAALTIVGVASDRRAPRAQEAPPPTGSGGSGGNNGGAGTDANNAGAQRGRNLARGTSAPPERGKAGGTSQPPPTPSAPVGPAQSHK